MSMFSPIFDWLDQMGTWGVALKTILVILAGVFAWISGTKSIAIVSRGSTGYKERNGEPIRLRRGNEHLPKHERPIKEYHGFNLMWPWIDKMKLVCNLEELRGAGPVKVTKLRHTCEANVKVTIRTINGYDFLYKNVDPRAQIDFEAQNIIQQVLSHAEMADADALVSALMAMLPDIAASYGIEIVSVMVIGFSYDGVMEQAHAQNRIADAMGAIPVNTP